VDQLPQTQEAVPPAADKTRPSLLRLFLAFLRLGSTAFGGPAMVAYIGRMAVEKKQWLTKESFESGVALCQSIPGATAMQTAAYVGLRAGGPRGALAAFVGFGLPAFVLMVVLAAVYHQTRDLAPVLAAFHGLHVVVVALIANAAFNFGRSSLRNWRDALLATGAAAFLVLHGNPIVAIVGAAALGLLLYRSVASSEAEWPAETADGPRRPLRFAAGLVACVPAGLATLFFLDRMLFALALLMLKIDLFAFGGGFASVPLMLHEVVDARAWLDSQTFMDGIALGQVTPGPIVITATFIGYQVAGPAGSVVGTLSIFTPSFLMVLATVPYFDRLQRSLFFRRALRGVLVSFVGLLAAVAVNLALAVSWSIPAAILAVAALVALRLKVDILWVVLAGAIASILFL
jgi:chromate transporter